MAWRTFLRMRKMVGIMILVVAVIVLLKGTQLQNHASDAPVHVCPNVDASIEQHKDPCAEREVVKIVTIAQTGQILELGKLARHAYSTSNIQKKNKILEDIVSRVDEYLGNRYERRETQEHATGKMASAEELLDACPEVYRGLTKGSKAIGGADGYYLDEVGWEFENCSNAQPLEKMVTLVLNGLSYSNLAIESLISQIRNLYPKLKIFVSSMNELKQMFNVDVVPVEVDSEDKAWSKLVAKVDTKYAVVLRDVNRFTNYTRLERLVSVSYRLDIPIVGGASVGLNGHWWNNCYQTHMRNYYLKYTHGYHFSKDSCQFCEHLTGPFLARTDVLKSVMTERDFVFEKMFLETKRKGIATLSCPDVMFHVDSIVREKGHTKQRWLPFARDQMLTKITGFHDTFEFGCSELGMECPKLTQGMAVAPCCLDQMKVCVKKLGQLATSRGVVSELVCGSLMGTLKVQSVVPWEIDTDFHYYLGNDSATNTFNEDLAPLRCRLGDVWNQHAPTGPERGLQLGDWQADYTPKHVLSSLNYKKRTGYNMTRVLYEDEWIATAPSPGLNVINRYRTEVYRHVSHPKHGGSYENHRGGFAACPKPGHHACLDQFRADGNLQFLHEDIYD